MNKKNDLKACDGIFLVSFLVGVDLVAQSCKLPSNNITYTYTTPPKNVIQKCNILKSIDSIKNLKIVDSTKIFSNMD